MNYDEICVLSLEDLGKHIKSKKVSPVDATEAALARVKKLDGKINAFITVCEDDARKAAAKAEKEIKRGKYLGPLHGVPLAIKDIFATKGVKTTSGSKIFKNHIPSFDSTVWARLKAAGAILIGKLNMHEFAWGPTTENPHFGACRNPWDTERIAGGSSGGSGATVAADMCFGSLGTDTGGSIRIPSCLCGIFGLKPTYGLVSRHGVTPLAWSLDHAGPMTKTVADAAIMLRAIAGYDALDPSSAQIKIPNYRRALDGKIRGLKVSIPKEFFFDQVDEEVEDAVQEAITTLRKLGAVTQEISFSSAKHSLITMLTIIACEATSFHEELLEKHPEDYGPDVRARIELGKFTSSLDYLKCQRYRAVMLEEVHGIFEKVDVLLTPTCPISAPKVGEGSITVRGVEESVLHALPRFTGAFNLVGLPTASIPIGFNKSGLPMGMHVAGRHFDDTTVLKVCNAYEQATNWRQTRPSL